MKKLILSVAAIFAFGFASAQDNIIKANPLALLGGSDLLSFEHKFGEHSSALVGGGIGGYTFGTAKYTTTGGELQYRYYFTEALKGFYGGAQAAFNTGKVTIDGVSVFGTTTPSSETNFSSTVFGGKVGYQWLFANNFVIDLNLGAGFTTFKYDDDTGSFAALKGSGVLPNFGFGVGYNF